MGGTRPDGQVVRGIVRTIRAGEERLFIKPGLRGVRYRARNRRDERAEG